MENIDITDADSADRIAVVGVTQIDKLLFFGTAFMLPVLKSNFYSRFYSSRTIVGIEYFVQPLRRNFNQLLCQFGRWFIYEPQQCSMSDFIKLVFNSGIDFLTAMTVDIDPQTGNTVVIGFAFCIVKFYTFAMVYNQLLIFIPALHLRKRVPHIFFIHTFPLVHLVLPPASFNILSISIWASAISAMVLLSKPSSSLGESTGNFPKIGKPVSFS